MLEKVDLNRKMGKKEYKEWMDDLQPKLSYLQRACKEQKIPVMIVFEGFGAAGKGTLINKIIEPLDPRGFSVYATAVETKEEKMHPFLWRFWTKIPSQGRIAIFDRSWYRRVLVDRFDGVTTKEQLDYAFGEICSFEKQLTDDGMVIIKLFADVSKKEQKKRFDKLLEEKGYEIRHTTEVMTMPMTNFHPYPEESVEYEYYGRNSNLPSSVFYPGHIAVQLRDRITDEWIESLFRLNGTTRPTLRRIVPSMFKAIPKETIVACIEIEGRMVASGLGILDRGHIGLYAIYVDASCRRKHFARAICSSILTEAQKKGATHAYLQVVKGNTAAKNLYTSLGFEDFYTYWFRSKEV